VGDVPEKNPFWGGACSVYLMSSRVGLGIGTVRFGDFIFERPSSHGGVVHLDPLGLLRDSWRGAGRTGRSSPLGTHGNGTVWRGEITGGLTRGFAICTIESIEQQSRARRVTGPLRSTSLL